MTAISNIRIRCATFNDLPDIVKMLSDDILGSAREYYSIPLSLCYEEAFLAIEQDPNQKLIVALLEEKVVGTLQLTFTPGLSHKGGWRAQIEAVRVHAEERGNAIGTQMVQWAIEEAKIKNCRFVQLTTDKTRNSAFRFYQDLGFVDSHRGMKLRIS